MLETFTRRSPALVVQTTIKNIWQHALVDAYTQRFRYEACREMEQVLQRYDVSHDSVAIISGSALWAPYELSDYDFEVISTSDRSKSKLEDNADEIYRDSGIEFGDVLTTQDLSVHLLLTPDEYLAGSITLAETLRLDFVANPDVNSNAGSYWNNADSEIKYAFDFFFKYWRDIPKENLGLLQGVNSFGPDRSRKKRFQDKLQERATKSANPNLWKTKFLSAMKAFKLPSFNDYKQAINHTNGRLSISTHR